MAQKTKKCTSCKGSGKVENHKMDARCYPIDCPSCEGTGVVLFDEEFDSMHDLYIDDDQYYEDKE